MVGEMVGTAGGRVLGTVSGCVTPKCRQMSGRCGRLRLRERAQGSVACEECFKYFHVKVGSQEETEKE